MADLTADQLSDIRVDLADASSAFSDAELQRLWTRVESVTNTARRLEATKGLAIRAVLHDAAKFNDWTAGETSQKKEQIFKRYKDLYMAFYAKVVDSLLGTQKQLAWAQIRAHPNQERTEPQDNQWDNTNA